MMIPQGYPLYVEINDRGETWPAVAIGWQVGDPPTPPGDESYRPVIVSLGHAPGDSAAAYLIDFRMSWRVISKAQAEDMLAAEDG